MTDAKPCRTPMNFGQKPALQDSPIFDKPTLYRSVIGALQYLIMTKLDIAFSVNELS